MATADKRFYVPNPPSKVEEKAQQLQNAVDALAKFQVYAPKKHRVGVALVTDFTLRIQPMGENTKQCFTDSKQIHKAVALAMDWKKTFQDRVVQEELKAKDLDSDITGPNGEKMVNRWDFMAERLDKQPRAPGAPSGEELRKALLLVKRSIDELQKVVNETFDAKRF